MKKILSVIATLGLAASALAATQVVTIGSSRPLYSCGGTVEVTRSGQQGGQQVNLVLRNVKNCSNFDITAAGWDDVNYKSKKIPGPDGNRTGSFTLPKKLIESGFNYIELKVFSNARNHEDTLQLVFDAYRAPAPSQPSSPKAPETEVIIITPPSDGSGGW